MTITIIGAGMAGLLAANMIRGSRIKEAQPSLPNNHSAVLRFRSSQIGDILGIPFQRVMMSKIALPWQNPIADALAYSMKVSGVRRNDRSISALGVEMQERWVAPPNLIERMAERSIIEFNAPHDFTDKSERVISTIPMPQLMQLLGFPDMPKFKQVHGFNLRMRLHDTDAYATIYVPNPSVHFNRVSITGNELIAEYSAPGMAGYEVEKWRQSLDVEYEATLAASLFGIKPPFASFPVFKAQSYTKVVPIDEALRKGFINWATDTHNVFSLGRFATWRPGLLLDDLVKDIRLIERWLSSRYSIQLHR